MSDKLISGSIWSSFRGQFSKDKREPQLQHKVLLLFLCFLTAYLSKLQVSFNNVQPRQSEPEHYPDITLELCIPDIL